MSDPRLLIETPLVHDGDLGLWHVPDGRSIQYQSDSFVREELEAVLRRASDLSSMSPELEAAGKHWPGSYYLSAKRTQLLRPFEWNPEATVLEVGAGCGTISRFLGETFAHTVSVEGDELRSSLGAQRVRDLDGISFVRAPYDSLKIKPEFDAVFCIGVLEYAPLYNPSQDPFAAVLKGFAGALKADGALVLAIENKLGLKYFAGAAEDHTGRPYDGIEDYRRCSSRTPRTLGRAELEAALSRAGFEEIQFLFPFPDYKFPRCVITRDAANRAGGSVAELVGQEEATDYLSVPAPLRFNQRAAWRAVCENGLLEDLANSFLVFAGKTSGSIEKLVRTPWDAVSYSTVPREQRYWMRTEVTGLGTEQAEVSRQRMTSSPVDGPVSITDGYSEPWHAGDSLAKLALDQLAVPDCSLADLARVLSPWQDFLGASTVDGCVPGDFVDAIPQNLMVEDGAGLQYIDREIATDGPIAAKTVLIRGLYYLLLPTMADKNELRRYKGRPLGFLIAGILQELGVGRVTVRDFREFARLETELQRSMGKSDLPAGRRIATLLFAHPRLLPGELSDLAAQTKRLCRRAAARIRD